MEAPESPLHYLEIVTPEVEATCRMYAEICGWSFAPPEPALGNARVATLPGGALLGIRAPLSPEEAPVVRPYFRVPDLAAATQAAARHGGCLALDSMELPGRGRIAIQVLGDVQQGFWEVP